MKSASTYISAALLLTSLTACVEDPGLPVPDETLTIQIAQNQSLCAQKAEVYCYLVKRSSTDVWQPIDKADRLASTEIKDFAYTPGNRYTIRVNSHVVVGAPAFLKQYTWLETLNSTPDSTIATAGQP